MNSRAIIVDKSIVQLKRNREAVDQMADKALLWADDSSDCDNDCSDSDVEDRTEKLSVEIATPDTNPSSPLNNSGRTG